MSPEEERPPSGGGAPPGAQDVSEPDAAPARRPLPASRTIAWLRRFAKLWGFALFCIFVVYLFRDVALPFLFAILVAYILAPLVDRIGRYKVGGRPFPRGLAVILLYIFILSGLSLFIGYFIPKLSGDFARLFREAPQLFSRLNKEVLPQAGAWVDKRFGPEVENDEALPPEADTPAAHPRDPAHGVMLEPLPDGRYRLDLRNLAFEVQPAANGRYIIAAPHAEETEVLTGGKWERAIKKWLTERLKSAQGESKRVVEYGQKFVAALVSGIGRLFLVLMVAAFILVDLDRVKGFLRSLVPDQHQADYDRIVTGVDRGLSGVIRGQLLICLINGVFTYIGLLIFHVKYPLLLAGIACVMSLIPIFGSVLSSVPIVAIALISSGSFDLKQGLFVLAWICGIHLLEANFLNPKIMGDAAKIHPVLVVFALIAGEHSYGLVGALFAVPVASIIQTIFMYYRRRRAARATTIPAVAP
jgi:predicted PurR-regulated permease PerM